MTSEQKRVAVSEEAQAKELLPSLWQAIFELLDVDDVRMVCQVCCEWRTIGSDEILWRHLAERIWPERTLRSSSYGGSLRRLVLHRNTRNAVGAVPMAPAASLWRDNDPARRYYACRFLHLEIQPTASEAGPAFLRLYFDARGEADLRDPQLTTLAAVILESPVTTEDPWSGTPRRDAPKPAGDRGGGQDGGRGGGDGGWGGLAAQPVTSPPPQQQQFVPAALPVRRLGGAPWIHILTAALPTSCHLMTRMPGHFKGYMELTGERLSYLLQYLDDPRVSLVAVYACNCIRNGCDPYAYPLPPDYAPALLWGGFSCNRGPQAVVPFPSDASTWPSFTRAWRRCADYYAPGELWHRLASESDLQERQRWADHLPPETWARGAQWWVQQQTQQLPPPPIALQAEPEEAEQEEEEEDEEAAKEEEVAARHSLNGASTHGGDPTPGNLD